MEKKFRPWFYVNLRGKAGNCIKSSITELPLVIVVHFLTLPAFSTLASGILVKNTDSQ